MRQLETNTRRQRRAAVRAAAKGEAFPLVRPNAAGIDVGSRVHYVAVPPELNQPVRSFDCMTEDLKELGDWLKTCGVKTVALEATGVYWIPLVESARGLWFRGLSRGRPPDAQRLGPQDGREGLPVDPAAAQLRASGSRVSSREVDHGAAQLLAPAPGTGRLVRSADSPHAQGARSDERAGAQGAQRHHRAKAGCESSGRSWLANATARSSPRCVTAGSSAPGPRWRGRWKGTTGRSMSSHWVRRSKRTTSSSTSSRPPTRRSRPRSQPSLRGIPSRASRASSHDSCQASQEPAPFRPARAAASHCRSGPDSRRGHRCHDRLLGRQRDRYGHDSFPVREGLQLLDAPLPQQPHHRRQGALATRQARGQSRRPGTQGRGAVPAPLQERPRRLLPPDEGAARDPRRPSSPPPTSSLDSSTAYSSTARPTSPSPRPSTSSSPVSAPCNSSQGVPNVSDSPSSTPPPGRGFLGGTRGDGDQTVGSSATARSISAWGSS